MKKLELSLPLSKIPLFWLSNLILILLTYFKIFMQAKHATTFYNNYPPLNLM